MKKILNNGVVGKTYEYPNLITLHTNEEFIKSWIEYSVLDAESTFYLRELL